METLQRMPDIWDDQEFHTSRSTVLGELASNAIIQSPYLVPEKLSEAIVEFDLHFDTDGEDCFVANCEGLVIAIQRIIDLCPLILAWNEPKKNGHERQSDGQLLSDNDFIDLDALARNTAHGVTLQEKYRELHD